MRVVALIRRIWNKKLAISEARYLFKGVRFTYQDNITERKKIKENWKNYKDLSYLSGIIWN
ncbi:hypothetical protein ES703_69029 [subsurface metagenome]